jgi:hypothetical protein
MDRLVDFNPMDYPFQLDLPILNGKRFFEMVSYYENQDRTLFKDKLQENSIIKLLDTYDGKHRTGDKYIRTLFDCALIFYVDKFGIQEIERVIEKLFVWAYKKRLEMQAVYLETIDNYVQETGMFKIMRETYSYKDIINQYIGVVNIKYDSKLGLIVDQMKELGYVRGN